MADIASRHRIDTDRLLHSLEREWDVGVRTAAQWAELSDYEQMVFIETWAIPRGYYLELVERAEQGELSSVQTREFEQILAFIAEHRAEVEAVLEDSAI